MGLTDKIKQTDTKIENNQLTPTEYEFLFALIKNTTFKGEDVELVYSTALKLQQQYLQLNK